MITLLVNLNFSSAQKGVVDGAVATQFATMAFNPPPNRDEDCDDLDIHASGNVSLAGPVIRTISDDLNLEPL